MILNKSIKVSEKTYKLLTEICPKNKSYNDIIYNALIQQYTEEEYLTDEEAEYCNKIIDNIEKGNSTDTYSIDTADLDKKLDDLEKQGVI
ncbi:hypothetical protein [Methanosphaera cuniculi]|uniref:hypothetical protein n=1 Tax=Methanosphaera cuniculi TaxID=1077256 RepID=UPI0026DD6C6E|nr:hypothetical protein [Methanosphaera cuniculi]